MSNVASNSFFSVTYIKFTVCSDLHHNDCIFMEVYCYFCRLVHGPLAVFDCVNHILHCFFSNFSSDVRHVGIPFYAVV